MSETPELGKEETGRKRSHSENSSSNVQSRETTNDYIGESSKERKIDVDNPRQIGEARSGYIGETSKKRKTDTDNPKTGIRVSSIAENFDSFSANFQEMEVRNHTEADMIRNAIADRRKSTENVDIEMRSGLNPVANNSRNQEDDNSNEHVDNDDNDDNEQINNSNRTHKNDQNNDGDDDDHDDIDDNDDEVPQIEAADSRDDDDDVNEVQRIEIENYDNVNENNEARNSISHNGEDSFSNESTANDENDDREQINDGIEPYNNDNNDQSNDGDDDDDINENNIEVPQIGALDSSDDDSEDDSDDEEDEPQRIEIENDDDINDNNDIHPAEIEEPEGNPTESDLDTDDEVFEEDELEGALFQGINQDAGLHVPLTYNPQITGMDHFLVTLAEAVRHNNTYEHIIHQLEWLKTVYPHVNLPTNKKALWKTLGRDRSNLIFRLFCSKCKEKIGMGKRATRRCRCGASGPGLDDTHVGTFLQIRLRPQLQDFFKIPNIAEALNYRNVRVKIDPDAIEDIYDGEKYQELMEPGNFLSNENNYTFTLWTDGVKLTESSTVVGYPIVLQINELSPHARKKHMFLIGIFVGSESPDLNRLMLSLVPELEDIRIRGIDWSPREGEQVTSRFTTIIFTGDSVAKPNMLMMKQYNGLFGCIVCIAPGVQVGRRRVYPAQEYDLRTDISIRNDAEIATERNDGLDENGVKGFSALAGLLNFDLANGPAFDSCHGLFLGVGKQYFTMIRTNPGNPWYIGDPVNLGRIDTRLKTIKPPTRIARRPRKVALYLNWKASEWRNWVLYYSLPCLEGILPPRYLKHWAKFCEATYIYNNSSITEGDLNLANRLIREFVSEFEMYGMEHMTYNLHLAGHEGISVRNWGPLWVYTTFPFESLNRKIVANITSPNARAEQVVTRFFMRKFVTVLSSSEEINQVTKNHLQKLLKKSKGNVPEEMIEGSYMIGEGNSVIRRPENNEVALIQEAGFQIRRRRRINAFKKAIIHGVQYQVADNKNRKFMNCHVYSRYGFFVISKILMYNHENELVGGIIGKKLQEGRNAFGTQYIKKIALTERQFFIPYQDIISPFIRIQTTETDCVVPLSTTWETD